MLKKPRNRDRKYLDSFQDIACESCGRNDGTTVPAHVRLREVSGMGIKPEDGLVAGLCSECHAIESSDPVHIWMRVFKNMLRQRYREWKVGTQLAEARAEVERDRGDIELLNVALKDVGWHLQKAESERDTLAMQLEKREKWIVDKGLWEEFVASLPRAYQENRNG